MLKPNIDPMQTISLFLRAATPVAWLDKAIQHIPLLLLDHAHCERKAAANAMNLLAKYPEKQAIVSMMPPLAREELLHFDKVLALIQERKITYRPLPPSSYAQKLHEKITPKSGIERLCDQLLVSAIIEARSCERFNALATVLEDPILARFYSTLVKAEGRHFHDFLRLAYLYGNQVETRLELFLDLENELICKEDTVFRFHSGIPCLK